MFQEMELCDSKIKKIFIFSQKEAFLIFLEMEPCTFQPMLKKKKKQKKNKSFLFFFKRKLCSRKLKIQETETTKEFLMFEEMELFLYFKKGILRTQGA